MKHLCGGDIVIQVEIRNMFAGFNEKFEENKICLRPAELIPNNISIIMGNLYCLNCNNLIENANNEIKFKCSCCNEYCTLGEMSLFYPKDTRFVRHTLLHKTCVETYKKYVKTLVPANTEFATIENLRIEVVK